MSIQQQGYKVAESEFIEVVTKQVTLLQAEGWVATGGVERNAGIFQQAMVLPVAEKKAKEYQIVTANDPEMFARRVNAEIQCNGWELMGGPSFVYHTAETHGVRPTSGMTFMQAMVKY
jgi:hypothetical protein